MASTACLVTTLLCPLVVVVAGAGQMEVLYSWTEVDLVFPPDKPRESFINSGEFIPVNNLIMDVDVWKDRVFVTIPKFTKGVPVTLATVSDQESNGSHLLQPYPDWSWHRGDCDGITFVFRTQVDECGRLWVADSGLEDIRGQSTQTCPPQLLVFDLHNDSIIRRHRFPTPLLARSSSHISTVKVDSRSPDCSDSVAYIANVRAFQLFVYDIATDSSWRVTNNLFYPYPLDGHFHVNGVDFDFMEGVIGLALGHLTDQGDRTLYFHSMSSVRESWVSAAVVRNGSLFKADPGASSGAFHVSGGRRPSQSGPQDMTDEGVLLYSLVADNAVGCWDSRLPFTEENLDIVAKDDVSLQCQTGLKVYGDKVWTLSNRYQNYKTNRVPQGEINYRVNVGTVSDLVRNTRCDPRRQRHLR